MTPFDHMAPIAPANNRAGNSARSNKMLHTDCARTAGIRFALSSDVPRRHRQRLGRRKDTEMRMKMSSRMTAPALAIALVVLGGNTAMAATNSYFDKEYEFSSLKTFAFKTQHRISRDPIANNRLWGQTIHKEIASDLQSNGFEPAAKGAHADFLVAYYVGLKEKYDVQVMGYGYPGFWGPRRFRWAWGWPSDLDVWRIPYTDSTLIMDVIDGQTNQLIWRGYDANTIDMKKPDKRLDKAVDGLVKKFIKDTNAR
jgi:Domain of unknown function (DUF4136)